MSIFNRMFKNRGGADPLDKDNLPERTIENCVLCGKPTPYFSDTPVNVRKFYISGAGQLCKECYAETVFGSRHENDMSDGELLYLIELCRQKT